MNCQRIKQSGRAAGWLHSRFCAECRDAEPADAMIAFGIAQLRSHSITADAINGTLSALDLSPVPQYYRRTIRARRIRRNITRICAGIFLAGVCGFAYDNWTPVVTVPEQVMPANNSLPLMIAATKKMSRSLPRASAALQCWMRSKPLHGGGRAAVEQMLTENRETITLLRGCLNRPFAERLPTRFESGTDTAQFSFFSLAPLLAADAMEKSLQGKQDAALESALDELELGERIAGSGTFLGTIAGELWQAFGREIIWHLLPSMTADQAEKAARRMETIASLHTPFTHIVQLEANSGIAQRVNYMRSPNWRWQLASEMLPRSTRTWGKQAAVTLYLHLYSNRRIIADYQATAKRALDLSRLPYREQTDISDEALDPLNERTFTSNSAQHFHDAEPEAQIALLETALALHAHFLQKGKYPNSLKDLCPEYLSRVPEDPFQPGTLLQYRPNLQFRLPNGVIANMYPTPVDLRCTLYSVGPDGNDQGGAAVATKNGDLDDPSYTVIQNSKGDIVAGVNM